jgi:transcription elongation factor GreA
MNKQEEYLVTQEGLDKMKKRLEELKGPIRSDLTKVVEEMRAAGDVSENDGLELALDQSVDQEIHDLKVKIDNSKVISTEDKKGATLGNTVTIKDESGSEKTYEITSEDEANPMEGKISHKSPLGEAMMGKKVGDKFTFTTPRGEVNYEIIKC